MMRPHLLAALLACLLSPLGAAHATLLDRGPNLVYDDVLNMTWTRQAGEPVLRNWEDAMAWAEDLTFAGLTNWRLPKASRRGDPTYQCTGAGGADEIACRDNEMAYMFYYNLGGRFLEDKTGNQTAVGGQVIEGIFDSYWTSTPVHIAGLDAAWEFNFFNGSQGATVTDFFVFYFAWAVHVPEPTGLALLGIALAAAGWSRRRK